MSEIAKILVIQTVSEVLTLARPVTNVDKLFAIVGLWVWPTATIVLGVGH